MSNIVSVMLLALLGSVIALAGGVVFLFSKKASKILTSYSIPFAAGVLLTVSLVGLLPEAIHMLGEKATVYVLVSFLTAYVFEHYLFGLHHHDEGEHAIHYESSIPLIIIGDTIHNFVDGVAIAASYFVSPGLGLVTAISTFLHEVPHEVGDFGILLKAGWKKRNIIMINAISASATFLGAAMVLFVTQNETVIGILLAFAAGLFLYLGASDFLPNIHESKLTTNQSVIALLVGVVIMFATLNIVPHSHDSVAEADTHEAEEYAEFEDEHTNSSTNKYEY